MEIKSTIKKEVHSVGGMDGAEILVKNISLNLNSHTDSREVLLLLSAIVLALRNADPDSGLLDEMEFFRVIYDNFKPNNSPGLDSVLEKMEE